MLIFKQFCKKTQHLHRRFETVYHHEWKTYEDIAEFTNEGTSVRFIDGGSSNRWEILNESQIDLIYENKFKNIPILINVNNSTDIEYKWENLPFVLKVNFILEHL